MMARWNEAGPGSFERARLCASFPRPGFRIASEDAEERVRSKSSILQHPLDDGDERRFNLLQGYRGLLAAILSTTFSNEALENCHAV